MNFTYDLTKPPDGQWGAIQPDGSWSGMVGMLVREEIDVGNVKSSTSLFRLSRLSVCPSGVRRRPSQKFFFA